MAVTQAPRTRSDAVPLRTYRTQGRPSAIAGIGVHVPDRVLTNRDLEEMVDTSDQWITERTGIKERRLAEAGTPTFELATGAARAALERAETRPEDLDMILVATSTPDAPFPSVACRVQNELGVSGCCAMDVLAACSGFAYALSLADAYVASRRADTILVIGAEVLSRYVDWTDRSTCVLFADGAGAAVVRPAGRGAGFRSWCLGADGRGFDKITVGSDIARGTFAAGEEGPRIGMKGPDVFKFATDIFIRQAHSVAAAAGVTMDDIDLWVPHQANRRIIEAAAQRVGLPMERVMVNIDRFGNTSTATIPLALDDALRQGRLHRGDNVLIAGFGSGLTWAACLLEWE
ncbi:MAG TPA: beta-ketoacyl-ACP synthase III [Candidatus Eisenbacteria bacterium]|nr:beta-ketoacyl-ACP synthase III [Candidatus Eisenbacteria bacterium]